GVHDRSRSRFADTSLRSTSPTESRRSCSNTSEEQRNERAEAERDDVVGRLRGRSRAKRGEPVRTRWDAAEQVAFPTQGIPRDAGRGGPGGQCQHTDRGALVREHRRDRDGSQHVRRWSGPVGGARRVLVCGDRTHANPHNGGVGAVPAAGLSASGARIANRTPRGCLPNFGLIPRSRHPSVPRAVLELVRLWCVKRLGSPAMKRRRRLRRLVPDQELIRRRGAGEPLRELARDYGVAYTTLGRYFERPEVAKQVKRVAKTKRRLRRLVPDPELLRRRAAGEPLRELASDYGVAHTTLGRYFERPEVARRLRAERRAAAARRSARRRPERGVRRRAQGPAPAQRQ